MSDEVFLDVFEPFPFCRDFNRSPNDRAVDLRFFETLYLKSLPAPQSCSGKDGKSTATGAIYFMARGNIERNNLANQVPKP